MKVIVTRDKRTSVYSDRICLWDADSDLELSQGGRWDAKNVLQIRKMNVDVFKKLSGFTPRMGSCKRYSVDWKEISNG